MTIKQQYERIIGHSIRTDTYIFMQRMSQGEKYEDIYEDINKNRVEYNVKDSILLAKKETILDYLKQIEGKEIIEEEQQKKGRKSKVKEELRKSGIYGIYVDEKIVYIGKTETSFQRRFTQHKHHTLSVDSSMPLYNYLRQQMAQGHSINLKPLISIEDLQVDGKLTSRDIKMMELALIDLYKPICNVQGRISPYSLRGYEFIS